MACGWVDVGTWVAGGRRWGGGQTKSRDAVWWGGCWAFRWSVFLRYSTGSVEDALATGLEAIGRLALFEQVYFRDRRLMNTRHRIAPW